MIARLDEAASVSADPPTGPAIETTYLAHTGHQGRPRIEINPDILATALEMRGPTQLASVFNTSARTIRRRALDYGLAEPGEPVFATYVDEDGTIHQFHTSSTAPASNLSDDELDTIMRQIVQTFDGYGRRMISGHLSYLGHHVPRPRLRESYLRVYGPPAATVNGRRIERRVYSVPGPNSLWHHDGQHGMDPHHLQSGHAMICDRSYSLEDCDPCICGWILSTCHCHPSEQ
jgi:hypothetical protein